MNFASLMSAQIAKQTEASSSSSNNESSTPKTSQKYQKRSEVEAAREEAYKAEQAAAEAERLQRASKKRQLEEKEAEQRREREAKRQRIAEEAKKQQEEEAREAERERRKRIGLPDLPPKEEGSVADEAEGSKTQNTGADDIGEDELVAKLRDMAEPARLFGETHAQRLHRYRRLERSLSSAKTPTSDAPISTSLEPVAEIDMKVPAKLPASSDTEARLLLSRQIVTWLNLVLRAWGEALQRRDVQTKSTFAGQAATNSYTQALSHLKPLFRKLESSPSNPEELPDDVLAPVLDIVRAAQERRYVDANDGYLKLSIGKAAWPIGVTMVGIHERSAREKLHESDKGKSHIMGDEMTRKFLQSLKRCLSYAQTRWPPEDAGQLMG